MNLRTVFATRRRKLAAGGAGVVLAAGTLALCGPPDPPPPPPPTTTTTSSSTTTTVQATTTTTAPANDPRCHSPGGTYVTNSLWMISDGVFIRGDVLWTTHDNPALFVIEGDGGLPSYEAFVDGHSIGTYGPSNGSLVCILTPALTAGTHSFSATELSPHVGNVIGPHDFTILS